jgi:hypothetical protein
MTSHVLQAFCDDLNEFSWLIQLDRRLATAEFKRIGARGSNPRVVEKLIAYDRPDVILLKDEKPVLTLEKSREVPTGHNVGQRFARLVRSVEHGIPAIKYFPFDAKKHGTHANICNLNARLLLAFETMWKIHDTPILAVNWLSDSDGELLEDINAEKHLRALLAGYIGSGYDKHCKEFREARVGQLSDYSRRCENYESYQDPPPSVTIGKTSDLLSSIGVSPTSADAKKLLARDESVVYEIGMTEINCRREDPYTGTQFIYDYIYCRNGPQPKNKFRNLILHFPKIRQAIWDSKNPNDPSRKSSNWYVTASAHVFADRWMLL